MRLFSTLVLSGCFALIAVADQPATKETPKTAETETQTEAKPASVWMESKMDYSQNILRGLAGGDFEAIGLNARRMRLLNKVEGFVRSRHSGYRSHVHTFQRVCDELIQQADEKNLPGVTLAFNQMTVNCVSCHASLRQLPIDVSAEETEEGDDE